MCFQPPSLLPTAQSWSFLRPVSAELEVLRQRFQDSEILLTVKIHVMILMNYFALATKQAGYVSA